MSNSFEWRYYPHNSILVVASIAQVDGWYYEAVAMKGGWWSSFTAHAQSGLYAGFISRYLKLVIAPDESADQMCTKEEAQARCERYHNLRMLA